MSWALFVEGRWDEFFIRRLLRRLGVDDVTVGRIGGGVSALHMVAQQIRRSRADDKRVALVLDADTSAKRTGEDLARELRRLELQVERSFLLPDDVTEGKLETLLERMAHPSHRVVYRCFDAYVECLRAADSSYSTPDSKARLYAYCHALGAELQAEKDYDDPAHWDHDAASLQPLCEFLRGLADEHWCVVRSVLPSPPATED